MKIKKLIRKAESFLSSDERDRKEKEKYLEQVLRKLSDREKKLKTRLEEEKDEEDRIRLKHKLAVVHAQRKKGVKMHQELLKKSKD